MAMMEFRELWSVQQLREADVQKFCHERDVSRDLQVTLMAYVRDRSNCEDLEASKLSWLPQNLLVAIQIEAARPLMKHHPFFEALLRTDPGSMVLRNLTTQVLKEVRLSDGQQFFKRG